jgi:hypothetical protein
MALLYSGSTGVRELTPRLIQSAKGLQTLRRWRGTMIECRTEAANHGLREMEITEEDYPWCVLEVTYEGWPDATTPSSFPTPDSQIVSLYELDGSRLSRSIWELPKVKAEMIKIRDHGGAGANLQGLARFRADLLGLSRGEETTYTVPEGAKHGEKKSVVQKVLTLEGMLQVAGGFGASVSVIRELFEDLSNGIDAYAVDAFILRRRSVGPAAANLLPAFLQMNVPLLTATLKGQVSNAPSGLLNVMPNGFWFAQAPVLKQTDENRLELFQQWQHVDEYSRFIYGQPV